MNSTSVKVSASSRISRRQRAWLCYAFLGSIVIHLSVLAAFHLLPKHMAASTADLDGRVRGVQLVATVRLGEVDVVANAATQNATASAPVMPQPEAITTPPPQPQPASRKAEAAPAPEKKVAEVVATASAAVPPTAVASQGAASASADNSSSGDSGTSRTHHDGGAFTTARADYLHNPAPRYPDAARKRGWQGVTVLRVQVRADGTADCVEILKTSGHRMLDQISIETVRGWKFSPARVGELAVVSWVEVPIRFQLVSS